MPWRRRLRTLLVASAVAYPLALLAIWASLALVGERWWPTTVALYVPRAAWGAPLPLIAAALLVWGPRWLLAGQAAAAAVVLFPLMGLTLAGPAAPSGGKTLRLLSFNVDWGYMSQTELRAEIAGAGADVIVLQATHPRVLPAITPVLAGFETRISGEFFVASRFPIVDMSEATGHPPCFVRATLDTPLGMLDVFNVHPRSPRVGLEPLRSERVDANTELRARQLAEIATAAAAATHTVVIAGDTNVPELSPLLRAYLGRWEDGFAAVGRGFGYTFPGDRRLPWLRLDRILAGRELRFLRFQVGTRRRASDHRAVWADLERR